MTDDDPELINSPLERRITKGDTWIDICIYRSADEEEWLLEVVDQDGGSTVWEDHFDTDQAALDAVMTAIDEDGIESFAAATGT